jgi:phage regulator Rha-like protein
MRKDSNLLLAKQLKTMKTNSISTQQTMTSLEIAELTGKNHFDLMRAIRKMEPAWEKVNGCKFALVEYQDKKGEFRPCYQLTKTECLYIATKFNDEARAKLVLRWQELELQEQQRLQQLCLPEPKKILALADEIIGEGLRLLNAPAEDTLTATQVAKTFNMTVWDFNCVLRDMGIQYRRYGRWNISDDLADRNLVRQRTHVSYSLKGEKKVKVYMTWTLDGLRFLNSKLGYPNF